MRTGVLVHGCNLLAENWRHIAWGDPPHLLGRIPHGVLTALRLDAELIVFGTGASEKAFRFDGSEDSPVLLEAEYSAEYLKVHFEQLANFDVFNEFLSKANIKDVGQLRDRIFDRLHLDIDSMNTLEELKNAGKIFLDRGIEKIVLVSSPTHIVRCLRDATTVFAPDTEFHQFACNVFASPSITCYEGTTGGDVVVVEPPHRPDRHVVPTHRRIQRMLDLQRLRQTDLVKLIEEFDDLLQRYENHYHTLDRKSEGPRDRRR